MLSIQFLGAAETVTGSRYLVRHHDTNILVDCGLFQGWRDLKARNRAPLAIDPADIDAIVLTHGHLDHTGYFPKLVKAGFGGRAHCTSGTKDLLAILLPDSGYLQEEEARYARRKGYSRHLDPSPLYTRADATASLSAVCAHPYDEPFEVSEGITATFSRAGHILGSSFVRLAIDGKTLTFSGDVGRPVDPIMKPPGLLPETDWLVVESTYGDRLHSCDDVATEVAELITTTHARGGTVVVPAFAIGRAQHFLHIVATLRRDGRIPPIPVFLDSPMAINATGIFCRHQEDHGLSESECHAMCELASYSRTPDESKAIDQNPASKIVISASGMMSGGRILHHLRRFLPEPQHTIVVVGYQASGTRGRALVDGAEHLRIHGGEVPVRAQIANISGLSAHADYSEMTDWLRRSAIQSGCKPRRTFVTHGEASAARAFCERLNTTLGWDAVVPKDESTWNLT